MRTKPHLVVMASAIVLCMVFQMAGCSSGDKYDVRYEFTGTTSATVYYFNEADNEVSTSATPPWSYEFSTSDDNHGVKVSAFSLSSGSATVKLYINGSLKKSGSDSGSSGFDATTGTYTIKNLL